MTSVPVATAPEGVPAGGWPDIDDHAPDWTATVAARWREPWIDWMSAVMALGAAGVFIVMSPAEWTSARWIATAMAAGFLAVAVRKVSRIRERSDALLVLEPDRLTFKRDTDSRVEYVLDRHRAGWLIARELGADWHDQQLELVDDTGTVAVRIDGLFARVEVRSHGVPAALDLPARLPVAVLIGSWWPHPACRASRYPRAPDRVGRWSLPEIAGFERHERGERLQWSVIFAGLATLCGMMALYLRNHPASAGLFALCAVALVAWRVRLHRRRVDHVARR